MSIVISFVVIYDGYFIYRELIAELHKRNKQVFLVSGGFTSIILPAAKILNIPAQNVFANQIKFYFDGIVAHLTKVCLLCSLSSLSLKCFLSMVVYPTHI